MKTRSHWTALFWTALYFILVLSPLIILLAGPKYSGRPALLDLSISMAFIGLAIMALQFVNSARLKFIYKPFGADIIYHFHRQIGIAAFFMVFAHPILLFILDQRYLRLLNIIDAPWRARFGVFSLLLLIGVVWLAEFRQKLKIPYAFWKLWHGILATFMIGSALVHIFQAGNYTDLPWKQVLWIGYSILFLLTLSFTRIIYPLKLMANPYIVQNIKPERGEVWTVQLKPAYGNMMDFSPGQFVWFTAWKTPFSDTEHPFSLSSSAVRKDFLEMSIKNVGPFTSKIKSLKSGDKVFIDGPYGSFNIGHYYQTKNFVFIPGGIGITPIMSMLRSMADWGDQRPVKLFYCNQTWDAVTFREEIQELSKRLNLEVIYIIERPPEGWKGESEFLNASILKKYLPAEWAINDTQIFLCGPTPMMNAVEKALQVIGFEESAVHSERYAFV